MRVSVPVLVVCTLSSAWAFAPTRPTLATARTSKNKALHAMILPEHVESLSQSVNFVSTSWLADAAAEVVKEDVGLWQSYLNIFKGALELVHQTVDPPLRSMGITQTWGISIALFTAGVRSLLIPLSVQQSKSTEYMKALKPYQDEIKQKFKGNQDAQNRAVAKLFEDAQQNPLSGCLLSLAQFPIFIGLYRGVRLLAMDNELNEPFLFIPSLEGPVSAPTFRGMEWLLDGWTSIDGFPTPSLGWETTLAFLIMPVLLVVGQSMTMNVLTPPVDTSGMSEEEASKTESTQKILKFLPLMIGFFSLQVPAGLTIYWFTSNIFSLTQSLVVRAYYEANPPDIELPDYWDALDDTENMSADDKRKAMQAGLATGPSWEDVVTEANFHYVVQRTPLRPDSEAWKRVESGSHAIPTEMAAWVGSREEQGETPVETSATAAPAQ